MSEAKTQPTTASVSDFLAALPDAQRRADGERLLAWMQKATGAPAVIWGSNIVGFGSYRYTYASGHSGDWPLVAFSPRKNDFTVYLMDGTEAHAQALAKLGPHKTGKSCLYLKRLDGLDVKVLERVITASVKAMRKKYPAA